MKKSIKYCFCLLCFILWGCITEYFTSGIDEIADILVVEGIITDDETLIRLNRSGMLDNTYYLQNYFINTANVYVDWRDEKTQTNGYIESDPGIHGGRYIFQTGLLNPEREYRLRIELDGDIYHSEYSFPIKTPEIDSIFWVKKGYGQNVSIYVATKDLDKEVLYYRWTYKEDWEINSYVRMADYPYRCWNASVSSGLHIGTAERTVVGKLMDILIEVPPTSRKLSVLYRINIKQNAISKRAYDYFENIKKNAENVGSIFAPTPSELRGNITCITDPVRPVIGYIDVSSTKYKQRFISSSDRLFEIHVWDCDIVSGVDLRERYDDEIPRWYIQYIPYDRPWEEDDVYTTEWCVDCTLYGNEQKPDDWPN